MKESKENWFADFDEIKVFKRHSNMQKTKKKKKKKMKLEKQIKGKAELLKK